MFRTDLLTIIRGLNIYFCEYSIKTPDEGQ